MFHWKTCHTLFGLQITPANPETICLFAQFLADSFRAPQSIVNYVAPVKLWHSLLGPDMTTFNSLEFVLTKRGLFRILAHIPKQAASVTPEHLSMFRQHLHISDPIDTTFWPLFLIAFFTMAHKSNLVPDTTSSFDPDKQLSREKVLVGNGCLMVICTWVKTYKTATGHTKCPFCIFLVPIYAMQKHIRMCHLVPLQGQHPNFPMKSSRGPVPDTYQQINQILKKLLGAWGFNPEDFSAT